MDSLTLRKTTREDMPSILAIEQASFISPWSVHTFLTILHDRRSYNLTARYDGEIVGYCFSLGMKNMVHLLNLAVRPDFRRRGIARRLLNEIFSFARSHGKSYVFLEVRKSNDTAKRLYASMGFTHVSTWQRYYSDSGEDASIMVKRLDKD
ncbi:MAG: ribosomal protein S18-alanine N-acetyltransferase [Desulfomonilia bacterium]|jgi:ribosomal-protein-alanine N-acetyltransferase|uniref:Dihydroorotate dehydrogenase B (NAD(+)), electron transfer subunit n=1 Tax=anaerobic digester metagenome TaxID=1263854 RepID=A0A485M5S1_9ZZZZ|nr:ribosomal protein S18-alanine N-acetyltransferase [Pseudomonadota bacterium]HON38409.1 ribosomal protein S18-alanine N-acetyltransferase [Deltaproteobacteria bacterium]HRS56446.1 ribosomal protein S18-alanine N-acetyltransferase [Desulfomonilia bacterium]HPD21600.1 ribosomal protein S18-alanine N-acetyltransferase [Deltaproteobacteria bacterium]HPX19866.1 ribosomal protein S18-alanine N-acetyltransferase [Deltaproteobacteria bacterium]